MMGGGTPAAAAPPSWDFESYWEGTWSAPTYTMGGSDVDDGDTAGTGHATGAFISTDQEYGGAASVKFAAGSNYPMAFTPSANPDEITVSMWVYLPALTGENALFYMGSGTTNRFRIRITVGGTVLAENTGNSVVTAVTSTDTVSATTWTQIQVTSSVANNILAVKVGENAWQNDADADAVTAQSAAATTVELNPNELTATDGIYVDNWQYKYEYTAH